MQESYDWSVGAASKFGAGATASFMTPFVIIAFVLTIILIFLLPRKYIIIEILCFIILIPSTQQFYFGGVHLFVSRIILLLGLIRAISNKGHAQVQSLAGGWNSIDTSFSLFVLIQAVSFSLQYLELAAVVNQIGFIWDFLSGYFLMRSLILDREDINRTLKCIAYIFALLAFTMLIEQIYMMNLFGYIGGFLGPEMRDGSLRSRGSFQHALTVGTIGATSVPLFMFLWNQGSKRTAALGIISATIMTITAHSSGPLIAYASGIIALLFWPQRLRLVLIRRIAAFLILILHLVMKAPVWFLIARIDLTGSSSSYHRAELVDLFIKHFWEWWLIGTPNHIHWGLDIWDVQNQYVSTGFEGGLGAVTCFIAVIIYGFSIIGKASKSDVNEQQERCLWDLGAVLFSYMVGFVGVNLFDQSRLLWFMLLSIISAYTAPMVASTNLYNDVSYDNT